MLSKIWSAATLGIDAVRIVIEVNAANAHQPGFVLVGLPDASVRESYARVKAALYNCGFFIPCKYIVVNLSPADVRKEGSAFDLPIALGILNALELITDEQVAGRVFAGELSLDGTIAPIRGALSISASLRDVRELIVPEANANEAAAVTGVRVIGVRHLPGLLAHLRGTAPIAPTLSSTIAPSTRFPDFADVRGQRHAKRALEVAAAGGHNVLMIGPPGSGKTMLAKRLPSILPPLTLQEAIVTTQIHSVAGLLPPGSGLLTSRPFRTPHHTISMQGLVGGGSNPRPGEVSLSHHGVLFLDELAEFRRDTLEVMRQPMEDGRVTISRAARTITFPSRFTLAAALNPCPCGFFNDKRRECLCTPPQISRYLGKISGPLLDRIDLQVEVGALTTDEIASMTQGESSESIRARVQAARARRTPRPPELDASAKRLLISAIDRLGLSARAHDRILKVARTIADLEGVERIDSAHVAEAVQYRALDRAYFRSG